MRPARRRGAGRINRWIRRCLFREERWTFRGSVDPGVFAETIGRSADHGRPYLFSLPRLPVNRLFVGRVTTRQISLKRRTHPLIWLVSPGTYYFSGRMSADDDAGVIVEGEYRLRPILALMYYVYFAIGAGLLTVSAATAALGAGMWIAVDGMGASVFLSGLRIVAFSGLFAILGGLHIALEKWLDRGNRQAVRGLLTRTACGA